MKLNLFFKPFTLAILAALLLYSTPSFSQHQLKKHASAPATKRPTELLRRFGLEINYYRNYNAGITSFAYGNMRMAFPNSSNTGLMADIEDLPNNPYVQDRFLYIFYKDMVPALVTIFIYYVKMPAYQLLSLIIVNPYITTLPKL